MYLRDKATLLMGIQIASEMDLTEFSEEIKSTLATMNLKPFRKNGDLKISDLNAILFEAGRRFGVIQALDTVRPLLKS